MNVSVGGIDQIALFHGRDGFHGVVVLVGCSCFHFHDVECVVGRFVCDDIDFEVVHAPVLVADDETFGNQKVACGLFADGSEFVVACHEGGGVEECLWKFNAGCQRVMTVLLATGGGDEIEVLGFRICS